MTTASSTGLTVVQTSGPPFRPGSPGAADYHRSHDPRPVRASVEPVVRIGILGGTGPQGRGLGRRFAMAGHEGLLGSRDAARAQQAADGLTGAGNVSGATNAVAAQAELVVVAVPYE